jgi:hypothetical protein
MVGFLMCNKKYRWMIKMCNSQLDYSQIRLKLLNDDPHPFLHIFWMIVWLKPKNPFKTPNYGYS